MKKIVYVIVFLISFCSFSQKVTVQGNWRKTLNATEITKAGLDYPASYVSNKKKTKMTINPVPNSKYNKKFMPFKVFVHKEDIVWHSNLVLEVKVSSTVHGNSTGTIYQAIGNNDTYFFETVGRRKNIPFQYKISGLSVTLPVANYSTEIVYTVLSL